MATEHSLKTLFPYERLKNIPSSDWRHRLLFSRRTEVGEMRGCVNRLISFAERQGVLNAEMLSRLGSDDYEQFKSAIYELAVAEFLSPVGKINWRPPGRNSRIGEFEIAPVDHQPIFVEVKTIFESDAMKRQNRNWELIKQVAHSIGSSSSVNVEFLVLQCAIVPRRFRRWLKRELDSVMRTAEETTELIFEDADSQGNIVRVKVEFTRIPVKEQPTLCSMSWGSGKSDMVDRAKEVIDGALGQLPNTKPALVVLVPSVPFGIDELEMIAVMFSFPKLTFRTGVAIGAQEPTIHYDLQGVVQPSVRRRLSAVGVWHHKWTREPQGSLDIYHNPLRRREISHYVLTLPNVHQLIPKAKEIMEWTPNLPPSQ